MNIDLDNDNDKYTPINKKSSIKYPSKKTQKPRVKENSANNGNALKIALTKFREKGSILKMS